MKLIMILLTVTALQVAAATYAQEVTFSFKQAKLKEVFGKIQAQTNYDILYKAEDLKQAKLVTVNLTNMPLRQALDICLSKQPLTYSIENTTILITRKPVLTEGKIAAAIPIRGRVTDTVGQPLPGVTILEKNTRNAAVTDANGNFSITVTDNNAVLQLSFIGFVTQEIPVAGRTSFNIRLRESKTVLNEVVVVGYGTQSRKDLSTAISTVGSKEIGRQVVTSFENALQGQAPGVQINNPTGQPGSAISVNIRGLSSVSLTTGPLYVIDGVPVQPSYDEEVSIGNQRPNPLSSINPNDIESIDVLKDGASAAIYGNRASNGVVVITTKRGRAGKPQIGFNMYYGLQKIEKKIALLNGQQFATVFNQARANAGLSAAYNPDTVRTNTNWQDLLYRTAPMQNYQLSVAGGGDKSKYYISGGYQDQQGILLNSDFKRYSVKINLDQQIADKFKIGTSLSLANTLNNRSVRSESALNNSGVVLGALQQIPTMPVYNANGTYALNPFSQTDNPYGALVETHNNISLNQIFGNTYGEYSFMKNLVLRSSIGIDYHAQTENQFNTRELPGFENAPSASRGSAATGTNTATVWLWENTLTYTPNLGNGNDLTLLAGQSVQNSDRFTSSASGFGFPSDAVPFLYAASNISGISSYRDQWGLISYFARANYNYNGRYYLSGSVRADGSSRFSKENRFGYFPAVSAAWRISQESFFHKTDALSEVKLRGSFGANGNQNIGVYDRFSTYGTGYNYPNYTGNGTVIGGIAPAVIGNNNVKWETTYQTDLGLDLGFLNDRLNVTLDAYVKNTNNLLTAVPLSFSSGAQNATIIQNLGKIQNKGFEIAINSVNVRSNGFNWNTQFNFSLNRNKVVDLGTLVNASGKTVDRQIIYGFSTVQKGQPLGAFYGYVVQGIFQSAAEVASAPKQPNAAAGDLRFADLNGDGVINDSDRKVIGDPNPKFISGITNTLSYKGVDLSFFFQGSFGNKIFNNNRSLIENMANPFNQSTAVLNAWTRSGQDTNIPREVYGDPNENGRFSTQYLESGTYVRLKNLTLGYTLPAQFLKKAKISSVRIYLSGQNMLTFTKYKGYDPEVNANPLSSTQFGQDYGVYPSAKVYTAGINVQF